MVWSKRDGNNKILKLPGKDFPTLFFHTKKTDFAHNVKRHTFAGIPETFLFEQRPKMGIDQRK